MQGGTAAGCGYLRKGIDGSVGHVPGTVYSAKRMKQLVSRKEGRGNDAREATVDVEKQEIPGRSRGERPAIWPEYRGFYAPADFPDPAEEDRREKQQRQQTDMEGLADFGQAAALI